MAQLPRYEAQIKGTQTDVSPALQGIAAAKQGQQILTQSLNQKLGTFFNTGRAIAEPKIAAAAEKRAFNEYGEGAQQERGLSNSYGFSVYRDSYNKRVGELTVTAAKNDVKREFDRIELENPDDPSEYRNKVDSYAKTFIQKAPDAVKPEIWAYTEALLTEGSKRVNTSHLRKMKDIETAETNDFLQNTLISATNAAYNNDGMVANDMRFEFMEKLDQQVENRLITNEERRRRLDAFDSNVRENLFVGTMDRFVEEGMLDNAAQYLDDFDTGTYDFSTAERDTISAKMRQKLNAAIASKKAEDTVSKEYAGILVSDATKVYKSGKIPDNMQEVMSGLGFTTEAKQHEFYVAKAAYDINNRYSHLTLPEQVATVNSLEQKKDASRVEIDALDMAKKNLAEKIKMAQNDLMSLAVQDGIVKQTAPMIPGDMKSIVSTLPIRIHQAAIASAHYGFKPMVFHDVEAQQFSDWLQSPTTSVDDKIAFIQAVESSGPKLAGSSIYNQLLKKGASVFAMAGSLVREDKPVVAKQILHGQTILREFGNIEGLEEVKIKLFDEIGNAMTYATDGDRGMVKDSALALYMYKAEQDGNLEKGLSSRNTKSVVRDLTNGVGRRNDQSFFLPKGADEDMFDDFIDKLTPDNFKDVSGVTPEEAVKIAQSGQLISAGSGKYRIKYKNGWLATKDNKPFILEY